MTTPTTPTRLTQPTTPPKSIYSAVPEEEYQLTIPTEQFFTHVKNHLITITNKHMIEQYWLSITPFSRTRGRAESEMITPQFTSPPVYTHTTKYRVTSKLDYEITTNLTETLYNIIVKAATKASKPSSPYATRKTRLYIDIPSIPALNQYYIVTADIDDTKPNIIRLEFELKDYFNEGNPDIKTLLPDWLKGVKNDD